MKRRVDESVKQEPARFEGDRVLGSPTSVVQTTFKVEQRESVVMPGSVAFTQQQSYAAMPAAANKAHSGSSGSTAGSSPMPAPGLTATQAQVQQFQRLKVEDALSYLDQVKFKFGNHPQVYNDFLDIMKEFKSQSIDTPGVIQRVSNLFKGHPELIVGFNTFLPPGYKIEVQANDQGYAFQVSVSMPSPTSSSTTSSLVHSGQHAVAHPAGHVLAQGGGTTVHTIPIGGPPPPSAGSKSMIILHGTQSSSTATPLPSAAPHAREPAPFAAGASANNVGPAAAANHHQHSAAHHAIAQAHQALSHGDGGTQQAQQSQPVEFNHAINYVNKIKNRFQGQPDKYKRFLEILHTYQKEQRNLKEGRPDAPGKHLTEAEVYAQVAKLFENQDDLLAEFGQFLPDATSHHGLGGGKGSSNDHSSIIKKSSSGVKSGYANSCSSVGRDATPSGGGGKFGHSTGQVKRSPSFSGADHGPPPSKKQKPASLRDISLAEAGKYGSLNDYAFFDKIRKGLKNQDVYENFLRCITIYNHEVVSRSELVLLVTPFLGKFPELFRWFKEFVGYTEMVMSQGQGHHLIEAVPNSVARAERPTGDLAMEIDYTTCKRLGASYCALPKTYDHLKCSGRTPLCREVLNDTWVSFPTWSEDSTFVTSRKTQYEEYIYRCEDERFELDVVIETNAATIRVLEGIQKKLQRLSPDEVNKFRLDDCLGGFSPTIHQRALKRVYGDKALDIIEGLKKNPLVAVPVVVRRLKAKEEEWREAQKGFNKVWRDQNEKYYLKSLDHQGINFKQTDVKALRSKSLFNEIETLFDERHEQAEEHEGGPSGGAGASGPHLVLPYKDKSIIADAANLLIHHVKRQTGVQKEDKQRIKQLLRQFIPDLFFHTRQELSDDERDDDDEKEDVDMEACANNNANGKCKTEAVKEEPSAAAQSAPGADKEVKREERSPSPPTNDLAGAHPDESYILFVANNHWYIFLRLHQILCDRLTRMLERAVVLAAEERKNSHERKESTAIALRLKPKSEIAVEDYYPAFLDMVKNVLDGNMDSNAYEDTLREMFGIHAYHAFTLDKVVTYAVRQLQHLVSDETCQECVEMLHAERRRGGAGGPCATAHQRAALEAAYQRRAEQALADENSFRIVVFKHDCKMTMELLETEPEEPDAPAEVDKWSTYVERFAGAGMDAVGAANASARAAEDTRDDEDLLDMSGEEGDELDSVTGGGRRRKAVFLPRNVRQWKQRSGKESREFDDDQTWMKPAREDKDDTEKDKEDVVGDKDKDGRLKSTTDSDSEKAGGAENRLGEPVPGLIAEDNTQCKFSINSYRVSYVVSKENYMYKRRALPKAKETHPAVSLRLGGRFRRWHASWARSNVTSAQSAACTDWLMGRGEDLVAHVTRLHDDNDLRRAPYRPYNRYRVALQAAADAK